MRFSQLIKSASFRLSAAYAVLFIISVSLLAGVTYFSATSELDHELRSHIAADSDALRLEYREGGIPHLLQAISERQHNRLVGGLEYALSNASGKPLYGTLAIKGCVPGWSTFRAPPDGDEPVGELEQLALYTTTLPGGLCLRVGDDAGKVEIFGSPILRSFAWVMLLSLTLAIAGGIFLSSRVLRRIEAINVTAEAIIDGDLQQRIPRRGVKDDLDRLAATLNRMLDRTTSLMESLRHISNDVAHDLRTPLGRLRFFLDEARAESVTPEQFRAVIDRAIFEVDGILETFGAILRIAQIESGSRRSRFERLLISEVVADVCEAFKPSIEDAGKSLRTDIEPDLWIYGDRELLAQSLANLLENTIVHTHARASIAVSLAGSAKGIELNVADDGPGVAEGERKRIFERFYRLECSRTTAGNGLGLSIVAAVAELHSAALNTADNHPGLNVGLVFSAAA